MSRFRVPSATALVARGLCLLLIAASGCRMIERWRNGGVDPQPKPDAGEAALAALENPDWFRAVAPPFAGLEGPDAAEEPPHRWRHVGVEDLVARDDKHRELIAQSLSHENPVVAANAAVALARMGNTDVADALFTAASNSQLKLHARLAAVEALAALNNEQAERARADLFDRFGQPKGNGKREYLPELHEELLHGLAARTRLAQSSADPEADRLEDALRSPAQPVRLAALTACVTLAEHGGDSPWADAIGRLKNDPDARVRAACLRSLVAIGHPQAEQIVADALHDTDGNVRLEAIAALGQLKTETAREQLERLLGDEPDLVRVAAIEALATSGDMPSVLAYADDDAWRIRRVVAGALAARPGRQSAVHAAALVRDRNPTVQGAMVDALADWPIELAGPLLLATIDEGGYLPRKAAAEQLAERWPAAGSFPVDAPVEERRQACAQLEQLWHDEFGPTKTLLAEDQAEPSAIRQVSAEEPLDVGPVATEIEDLASHDVQQRRLAAGRLWEFAQESPLPPEAVARIVGQSIDEQDPVVLRGILMSLVDDPSDAALELALASVGHPTADIRRRACEHLARFGGPEHAPVLVTALEDSDPNVVRATVAALGRIGNSSSIGPLVALLSANDRPLRLETAIALARMGAEEGPAALERLTLDNDPAIRRQTALRMSELGDVSYAALLIPLLDDHAMGVDRAALESLAKLAGRDVSKDSPGDDGPPTPSQRIARWKAWWREQTASAADAGDSPEP